jgi:hypothetical protein
MNNSIKELESNFSTFYDYIYFIGLTSLAFFKRRVQCRIIKNQGGDSQNLLRKFVRFFLNFGLKILILFRHKVLPEADIIKG